MSGTNCSVRTKNKIKYNEKDLSGRVEIDLEFSCNLEQVFHLFKSIESGAPAIKDIEKFSLKMPYIFDYFSFVF